MRMTIISTTLKRKLHAYIMFFIDEPFIAFSNAVVPLLLFVHIRVKLNILIWSAESHVVGTDKIRPSEVVNFPIRAKI